jgi:hypothetical protein
VTHANSGGRSRRANYYLVAFGRGDRLFALKPLAKRRQLDPWSGRSRGAGLVRLGVLWEVVRSRSGPSRRAPFRSWHRRAVGYAPAQQRKATRPPALETRSISGRQRLHATGEGVNACEQFLEHARLRQVVVDSRVECSYTSARPPGL